METPNRRVRKNWIDLTLIIVMMMLIATIFLFSTNANLSGLKTQLVGADEIDHSSEITEENSAFPGIRIVSDMSNDKRAPFALQYPQTSNESFNNAMTQYITKKKNQYIETVRGIRPEKLDDTLLGELNISFDTYEYESNYYSFVFTERSFIGKEKMKTTIKTLFYNHKTGETLSIQQLLGQDKKNLETFSTHVRSSIKSDPQLKTIVDAKLLETATKASWASFEKFAIHKDDLILYFNEGDIADASHGPLSIKISMSFLNPILAEQFQTQMVQAETIITKAPDNKKRVALTFDDGPHPKVTTQILNKLDKYGAKATFFMLGNRVQYYPEIAQDVFNRGHEIGNHTWSHPIMTKLSEAQIMHEFTATEEALVGAIGQESTVFRPPYGATNDAINNMLPREVVLWSIDTLDWKHRNAQQMNHIVKKHMHNNAIILMHDIHQSTADGLSELLSTLSAQGYEFVTVSEILQYR